MATAIFNFDSAILLWIQANVRTGFLTPIMKVITHLGDKGAFWILLSLILMIPRKTRRMGITCGVAMVIGLVVTNLVIKNWVARVRPYELISELELMIGRADDWSFPSGHTTNSLACAWVIFRRAPKKWGVPALIMAILITLSRIYVGVHYPTDIMAGTVIGICSAESAIAIVKILRGRFPAFRRFILFSTQI